VTGFLIGCTIVICFAFLSLTAIVIGWDYQERINKLDNNMLKSLEEYENGRR